VDGVKNVTGSTMDELLQEFKKRVTRIAQGLGDSGFFKNRQELGDSLQTFLREVLEMKLAESTLPEALFDLTQVLHTLSNRPVILLVDEYDTPTSHAVQHGYFPEVRRDP
jgi:hypothetical protein